MTEIIVPKMLEQEYSEQITYTPTVFNHPSPLFVKVSPVGGTTSPTLGISSVSTLSEFQIPSKIVNLSQSYISCNLQIPAGTAFMNLNGNLGCIIDRIVLSTIGSNTILADISNVGAYLEACDAPQTEFVDFKNKTSLTQSVTDLITGTANFLPTSQPLANVLPLNDIGRSNALLNPIGQVSVSGTAGDDISVVMDNVKHILQTGSAVDGFINVKLPLSMFKSTIMAVNKNLYFSGETLNFSIYWAPINSYAWQSTLSNPATLTALSSPTQIVMTNLSMYIQVEQNAYLTQKLISKVNEEGMTLPIPVIWSSKQNITNSTQHSITLNITKSHGNSLMWVAWSPFSQTETNSNLCKSHTTFELSQYQTLLNQIPILTNSPISTSDLYLYNSYNLENSVIQSASAYNNIFTHFDNFSGMPLCHLQDNLTKQNGIDLTRETQQYQLNAIYTPSATRNHYIFFCCQKQLVMTRNGVMLV